MWQRNLLECSLKTNQMSSGWENTRSELSALWPQVNNVLPNYYRVAFFFNFFFFLISAGVYQFSLWLTLEKSASETLYGGQLTAFSTQLVKPIYFISVLVCICFVVFLFPVIRYTSPNYIRFVCLKICLMSGKWLHLCAGGYISALCSRNTRGK